MDGKVAKTGRAGNGKSRFAFRERVFPLEWVRKPRDGGLDTQT